MARTTTAVITHTDAEPQVSIRLPAPSALVQDVAVVVLVALFTPAGMPWGRLHVHVRDAEA
ncbi:hypothetical protein [Streptomyces europaeiscabiei]|uniref:hypothetical protein n=1 Tax=Streptomyces europaeiscabiei TaxID=146819 RepID=UPI002E10BEF4|nr:hypothetical protein OHB30_48615 [Streptomyces europaeiscabiei]